MGVASMLAGLAELGAEEPSGLVVAAALAAAAALVTSAMEAKGLGFGRADAGPALGGSGKATLSDVMNTSSLE